MGKTIQIRDIPDSLYAELKRRAVLEGLSISDYLRRELARIAEQPTPGERLTFAEWLEMVRKQEPIDVAADHIVNAIRAHRDA